MTEVVAALIRDGKRFMIYQRPKHKARGLLWEFVGGKVEPGETKEQALIRECREELAVTVSVGDVFMDVVHAYPDLTVHLTLMFASITEGEPQKLEHQDIRFITTDEIDLYAFCPADEEILKKLKELSDLEDVILQRLYALQDTAYKEFQEKLIPTIDPDTVIGVRTGNLRSLAKELAKEEWIGQYLAALPHRFYDENMLHVMILCAMKDYSAVLSGVRKFLPWVDNWATCDTLRPPVFRKHRAKLLREIPGWLADPHPYTVRFGIGILCSCYLDDAFDPEQLQWVAALRSDEYYVNMMIAWFFATALAKQYDAAVPYLRDRRLSAWTHNKTIQKAIESFRISDGQKAYLRTLRIR